MELPDEDPDVCSITVHGNRAWQCDTHQFAMRPTKAAVTFSEVANAIAHHAYSRGVAAGLAALVKDIDDNLADEASPPIRRKLSAMRNALVEVVEELPR